MATSSNTRVNFRSPVEIGFEEGHCYEEQDGCCRVGEAHDDTLGNRATIGEGPHHCGESREGKINSGQDDHRYAHTTGPHVSTN